MSAKRKLILVVLTLATAVVAGGAYAATQSQTNPRQAFLGDLAKRLNVSPSKLQSALQGALLDRLKAAVASGRITQAQANAIARRAATGGEAPLLRGHFFRGRGGPMGPGGPPGGPMGPGHGPLGAAASYLGVSPATLFKDLSSGKSLAQVAKAHGKSAAGLKQAMLNDIKTRLDKAVAAKVITKTQEQKILSRFSARFDKKINRAGFGPRFRHGGPGAPPGGAQYAPPGAGHHGPGGPPQGFFGGAAVPSSPPPGPAI
jgi:hypothetical protein